ncbi:MAG: hypothetical protein ACREMG_12425 [Gemmatimonadales bacterium]
MMPRVPLALFLALASCSPDGSGGAACGLAALAGPTALLTQFSVPRQTLSVPPARLPERVVARVVAGPALPAIVGRQDTSLVIGVDGPVPETIKPAFGVLVVDQSDGTRGVVLFEGTVVEGAPRIGTVSLGSSALPLIGIQVDPAKIEDPRCPLFPDSVLP